MIIKCFLLLFLLPAVVSGQKTIPATLENYMQRQVLVNDFAGSVIVMKDNKVLLRKAYGQANREWQVKHTTNTKFVLASVTKYFTAVAIMQLAEAGLLSINSKLSEYFPAYPKGDSVTIHMLLTHTAGLPLDFEELYMDHTTISRDSALAVIQQKPYLFSPGTNCKYSNIGYFLLAMIIEKTSGKTYAHYLQKNIFAKAGMTNSGICNNDSVVLKKANIYYREGGSYAVNPYINWNLAIGLDGMYSTTADLYKADRALRSNLLLSEKSQVAMTANYNKKYPDGGFLDSYGYGVFTDPYYNHGHHLLTHSGGFVGTMTSFDRYPDEDMFVAVLSNNQSESHMISYGLAGIVFGKPLTLPYLHQQVRTDTATLHHFAGSFGRDKIFYVNNKLYLNTTTAQLLPESEVKFFRADNPDRTYEFVKDKKGTVIAVLITKGGITERVEKSQ